MRTLKRFTWVEICELTGMDQSTLRLYIEHQWISPASQEAFDEEDLARAALIRELQENLGVNEASVPIVLHLLDQLYSLRERLRSVSGPSHGS
jgi:chaperone modulatory protein CbpM